MEYDSLLPALYLAPLQEFLTINATELLGTLTGGLANEGFDTTTDTTFSWKSEIADLQTAFGQLLDLNPTAVSWTVLFEYVLPVSGKRMDCVLIADDVIYVIEYKGGSSTSAIAALRQAQDYALNLSDFHEESRGRIVVPIAVGLFKTLIPLDRVSEKQGAAVSAAELSRTVLDSHKIWSAKLPLIEPGRWNASRYFPIPTIIEAASEIYNDHDVKELARSRSGSANLEATQTAVTTAVADARLRGAKKLIVITGVPGAGKTLAGLNTIQHVTRRLDLELDYASFLSGNGPLVAVIQEALKRSVGRRQRGVARSISSRVREIHRFVRDTYADGRAPAERLIVFDEAQRAWTAGKNLKKFGRDISEPEMVLEIMGRHQGWAVVVALVGGGQEIHSGEAGLAAWGDAMAKHEEWEVITSPEAIVGGASVAGSRLFRDSLPVNVKIDQEQSLHLAISKRSYDSEGTAAWVNAILDSRADDALGLAGRSFPIFVTRNIEAARRWLRTNAKGRRRAGLLASSGAARLRADGVEPPTFNFMGGIDYVKWFLEPAGDFRSSNQLEVALSEFEMQGLEIDLAAVLWGGDLVFPEGQATCRRLSGQKWRVVSGTGDPQASADDPRTRILNKYRVLLTRFRKGMVVFVPQGSPSDDTYAAEDFDTVFEYLLRCGIRPLTGDSSQPPAPTALI